MTSYLLPWNQKIDKLKQSNVFIAAENTWRGIVYHSWLYSQILLKVYGKVPKQGMGWQLNFKIQENIWKHLKVEDKSGDCLLELNMIKYCKLHFSISSSFIQA